jgi:AmmeMemoRadiSam system protein B
MHASARDRRRTPCVVVPVLVGNLSDAAEAAYGRLLAPYLADPRTLFVVSSDFCHWGARFSYRHVDPAHSVIHAGIEALDRQGMAVRRPPSSTHAHKERKKERQTEVGVAMWT